MPRAPRMQAPGACYHITSRGNRRAPIVIDDDDRRGFVRTLAYVVPRFRWSCLAYCLMTNHFHLVVETPMPNLAAGMQRLNSGLAATFNRKYSVRGHLFQGRYHSVLVDEESQLLELVRYVVLNPVRAGLCDGPADWSWSSFRATTGEAPEPPFLETYALLSHFGRSKQLARHRFREFVEDACPVTKS